MKSSYKIIFMFITFMLLVPIFTEAQNWELKILEVDTTFFPKINTNFVLFESKSRVISDLTKNNIRLFEGKREQKEFTLELKKSKLKLKLVIMLDVSGSMKGQKIQDAKKAIREFLSIPGKNDECALITFGSDILSLSNFTNDINYLATSIEDIPLSSKTRLYDGLLEATKLFSSFENNRNAIILVTDGKDEGSLFDLNVALDKAKRNNVEVYSIGIGENADLYTLAKISEETGAGYHGRINPYELRTVLENIYNLLTQYYQVSFFTPDSIVEHASVRRNIGLIINYADHTKTDQLEFVVPKYNPKKNDYTLYFLIIGFILLSILILIFIIISSRRKTKENILGIVEEDEDDNFVEVEEENNDYEEDETTDDEDWNDEFKRNVQEGKTVEISKGKFRTTDSLGYLVMRSKKYGMHIYEIKQSELIIGRGAAADILLDDEDVSKLHTKVRVVDGTFFVDDLGSTNGTFVNGNETFHAELKDGDELKVGDHEFVFKCV